MTPEDLKREDEFLEAQAKAIREHLKWGREYGLRKILETNGYAKFADNRWVPCSFEDRYR